MENQKVEETTTVSQAASTLQNTAEQRMDVATNELLQTNPFGNNNNTVNITLPTTIPMTNITADSTNPIPFSNPPSHMLLPHNKVTETTSTDEKNIRIVEESPEVFVIDSTMTQKLLDENASTIVELMDLKQSLKNNSVPEQDIPEHKRKIEAARKRFETAVTLLAKLADGPLLIKKTSSEYKFLFENSARFGKPISKGKAKRKYSKSTQQRNKYSKPTQRKNRGVGHSARGPTKTRGYKSRQYRGVQEVGGQHPVFKASIYKHGQTHFLGKYPTAEEAASAYNAAATRLFGDRAILNHIKGPMWEEEG